MDSCKHFHRYWFLLQLTLVILVLPSDLRTPSHWPSNTNNWPLVLISNLYTIYNYGAFPCQFPNLHNIEWNHS